MEDSEVVRVQSWPVDAPAELELSVDVGRVRVRLVETAEGPGEVRVEVRHDPTAGNTVTDGISGLLNWLGGPGGPPFAGGDPDLAADAVRGTEITWSDVSRRLVVRSPRELPLRLVPLSVTVTAPPGSRPAVRTGAGDVDVSGRAGWAAVKTGSGDARVAAVDGDADVTTGSGDVTLGAVSGRARLRTGSGSITLAAAGGPTEIRAGSGDVTVGEVTAEVGVRTGSGGVTVTDARSGELEVTTGSGDVRVAVHPGVVAELDLSSGSGGARSELDVHPGSPGQGAALRVHGRSGSGEVRVTRAAVPA